MSRASSAAGRTLDSFDRAILRIIQRDNKTPQRSIAEAVNLSAAAVQRRIAAMEAAGVIERNVAIVDTKTVQMAITAIVEVRLTDERLHTVDMAKSLFRDAPEVQQCYYVTGGISFMLVIVSPDMAAYEATTRRLFAQNEAVASFRSLIALDRVKVGAEIVIP
ncbi:Lrp/AsnC family transcriptional regulator [Bradyrhizobium tropiciagri]|uniref:Lrp/AsnC family transcriptional regulator n=1 Tax=Bradyrhizobium tropiciagri TaxID=312253 RepID=UPI001BAE1B90|nr:Lrp/AsnC family transcriptional regulator [Bradyrhizobium tropiciagri]MBR0894733.1 Lrp/AsnC family transcriptional regulator [Bradyrhizobium tropiciagri]